MYFVYYFKGNSVFVDLEPQPIKYFIPYIKVDVNIVIIILEYRISFFSFFISGKLFENITPFCFMVTRLGRKEPEETQNFGFLKDHGQKIVILHTDKKEIDPHLRFIDLITLCTLYYV